ncbi:hypothetical protein N9962_00865 [bacterium]|nr:hypothetical protein [bacterium]
MFYFTVGLSPDKQSVASPDGFVASIDDTPDAYLSTTDTLSVPEMNERTSQFFSEEIQFVHAAVMGGEYACEGAVAWVGRSTFRGGG